MNNNSENDIMRCVNCGQELYQDEKFCRNCGTKIERQAETDTMICRNCGGVVKKGLFCIQCGHKAENEPTVELASISTNEINGMNSRAGVINTSALLDRAYIALADKEWGAAYNFCEQVLNQEPQCADAYIVQLLSALKCGCRSDLSKLDKPFDDLLSYKKAIRFADETSQNELIGYNNIIRERNILEAAEEEKRLTDKKNEELYLEACSLIIDNENALKKAQDLFINLGNYKDSSNKADECINRLEVLRKNTVYTDACRDLINGTTDSVQYAMKSFESIIDWKDSAAKIDECKNKLARIEELQYESEQAECELADSFKKKKIIKFSLIAVGIIVILVPVLLLVLPAVSRSKEKKSEQTKYTDDSMELSGESSDILCFFDPETGKYLMENDKLRFEMDENTTQFSVTYKETDTVWSTNEKSPIVRVGMEKDYSGYVEGSFDTRNAVEKNKYGKLSTTIDTEPFVMTAINDECIQVEYELSNRDVSFIIPEVITEDRFFSFVDKLSDKEKKQVLNYYRKYDKDNLKAKDNYDELRILYPAIETDIIYVLRDNVKVILRQKIAEMLAGAGYTEDDYKQDLKGSDIEYSIVRATIEYKLDNGDFIATVKNIEWDFDDYSGVLSVKILPGFGISAASEYSEIPMREEYIRIPENYMTDIHFDELCENQIGTRCCYPDTYNQTGINVVDDMKNMDFDFYPYFGISNNGQTVICCPETYISSVWISYMEDYGSSNSYDDICLDYIFDSDLCISYQKNSEISQRYIFINGDDAETIRNAYNDYLFPENRRNTDEIPNLKENQDPEATYQTAIDMVKAGRMKEAASLLRTIEDYKDSRLYTFCYENNLDVYFENGYPVISYGKYYQWYYDGDFRYDPIEWYVIDIEKEENLGPEYTTAVLLSKYILDYFPYEQIIDFSWEQQLDEWLHFFIRHSFEDSFEDTLVRQINLLPVDDVNNLSDEILNAEATSYAMENGVKSTTGRYAWFLAETPTHTTKDFGKFAYYNSVINPMDFDLIGKIRNAGEDGDVWSVYGNKVYAGIRPQIKLLLNNVPDWRFQNKPGDEHNYIDLPYGADNLLELKDIAEIDSFEIVDEVDKDGRKWYKYEFSIEGEKYSGYSRYNYLEYIDARNAVENAIQSIFDNLSDDKELVFSDPYENDEESFTDEAEGKYMGIVTGTVNVRSGPGTDYDMLLDKNGDAIRLTSNHEVYIIDEQKAKTGQLYYKIQFEKEGDKYEGYSTSTYILKSVIVITPTPICDIDSVSSECVTMEKNKKG